jgi:hypothetical protein
MPGEYRIDIRTFFEIYPDPHAGEDGWRSAEHVAEEAVYTRDYVRRHLPSSTTSSPSTPTRPAGSSESRWPRPPGHERLRPQNAKGVKLREYWDLEKHVIWTEGGRILVDEANPYPWLPYVMFRGAPVPGRFWPDCTVTTSALARSTSTSASRRSPRTPSASATRR